jgi:radical SAM superfamily enzyme YgiQ (UPF0313 family)
MQIGRGCSYGCSICGGKQGRVRTCLGEFERGIHQLVDVGHRKITFVDNNFFAAPLNRCLQIVAGQRPAIEWSCSIKADYDMCRKYLPAMVSAGCVHISIDVQHVAGSIHERNHLFGRKYAGLGVDYYIKLIQFVREHGIEPTLCFHLGMRGETERTIKQAQEFFEATGAAVYDLRPFVYPGSRHFELAFEKGKRLGAVSTRVEYMARLGQYLNNRELFDDDVATMLDVFNLSDVRTDTLIDWISYLKGLAHRSEVVAH